MEKFDSAIYALQSALHDLALDACRELNTEMVTFYVEERRKLLRLGDKVHRINK